MTERMMMPLLVIRIERMMMALLVIRKLGKRQELRRTSEVCFRHVEFGIFRNNN